METNNPLIKVKGLKKYYPINKSILAKLLLREKDQLVKAVDRVDLEIYNGETLGLVGESGCGKSTLGRAILHLHPPTAGEVFFEGQEVSRLAEHKFRQMAQIIFQNPYSSLNPRKTVRQILEVPLSVRGVTSAVEREHESRMLLERVGLMSRHLDSYPHQFSGGQRQRIGIARALAMKPRFVVADEPVSALDVSVQAQIINLLEELQDEFKLTFLFVAHDLSVIYYVSSRVAVMYLGQIVEIAKTEDLFNHPCHPYTKALLSAIPKVEPGAKGGQILLEGNVPTPLNPPTGCRFHTRCFAKKLAICQTEEPSLVEVAPGHKVKCHLFN